MTKKKTEAEKAEAARIKAIPGKGLTNAITTMNTYLEGKEKDTIKFKGVDKATALENLLAPIIEAIEADEADTLPDEVISFYNDHLVEEEEVEEEVKTKETKKKEEKPGETVPKDDYGCKIGCGANKINDMLKIGATLDDIVAKVGTTKSRVNSHLRSLIDKGFFIDNDNKILKVVTEKPPERSQSKKEETGKKGKKETDKKGKN